MEEIQKLLDATGEPGSENSLTLDDVKDWIVEYVKQKAQADARFPQFRNKSHWNLLAADYHSSRDAHFIVAYFSGEQVTFLAGHGPIPDVREFGTNTFPENPDEVLDELARRFTTGERWTSSLYEIIHCAES